MPFFPHSIDLFAASAAPFGPQLPEHEPTRGYSSSARERHDDSDDGGGGSEEEDVEVRNATMHGVYKTMCVPLFEHEKLNCPYCSPLIWSHSHWPPPPPLWVSDWFLSD